jgi:UDP-glucose 4-epimerase
MSLKNKSALVTGGAGFIGSHLVDRIINEEPDNLVVVDNFSLGKNRNLILAKQNYPKLKIYEENAAIKSLMKSILEKENIDVVFNLAIVPLPACLSNPKVAYDTNVKLTSVICELARIGCYKTLIHYSSSEAYGDALDVPMTEGHPLNPTTPYGASKIASDHLVLSYIQTFGIDASIVRPFNAFGPRQNEKSYSAVIPLNIRRMYHGKPPIIHGNGLQTRDFTYVSDLIEATIRIHDVRATRGKVLNVASGSETTIKDLLLHIAKLMNYGKPPIFTDPRPGDVHRFFGSNLLAKALIGYEPRVSLERGLELTVGWYYNLFKNNSVALHNIV